MVAIDFSLFSKEELVMLIVSLLNELKELKVEHCKLKDETALMITNFSDLLDHLNRVFSSFVRW